MTYSTELIEIAKKPYMKFSHPHPSGLFHSPYLSHLAFQNFHPAQMTMQKGHTQKLIRPE